MDGHRHHHTRGLLPALLLAGMLSAGPAAAASFPGTVLAESELAALRGGLEVAGLRIDLTARLRTYVDQRLAAATEMRITRLTEGQASMTRRLTEAGLGPAATGPAGGAAQPLQLTTEPGGGGFVTSLGTGPSGGAAGPRGPAAAALPTVGSAPVAPGRTSAGETRIDHAISPQQVLSTVTNTANNRSIQQSVEIELRVHNFSEFAANARDFVRARALGRALAR